jgi:hypothetical protein
VLDFFSCREIFRVLDFEGFFFLYYFVWRYNHPKVSMKHFYFAVLFILNKAIFIVKALLEFLSRHYHYDWSVFLTQVKDFSPVEKCSDNWIQTLILSWCIFLCAKYCDIWCVDWKLFTNTCSAFFPFIWRFRLSKGKLKVSLE